MLSWPAGLAGRIDGQVITSELLKGNRWGAGEVRPAIVVYVDA